MDNTIEIYDRVKIRGQAIFGQYLGHDGSGMVYVQDEETHKIDKYPESKIEHTYQK